jgi:hypothetical protein
MAMTNDSGSLDHDPETLKRELFAEWKAERPDGTREQFEEEWAAITGAERPSDDATNRDSSWDTEAKIIKHRLFEEWRGHHPDGTREQFEKEWRRVTDDSGA